MAGGELWDDIQYMTAVGHATVARPTVHPHGTVSACYRPTVNPGSPLPSAIATTAKKKNVSARAASTTLRRRSRKYQGVHKQ